jgi:DNA-binding MarR family transcriptional regulator
MKRIAKGKTRGREGSRAICARQILEVVPRAMDLLRCEMRKEAAEDLSVPQFRVLAFLDRMPGASLSSVADFIGVANATASSMVDRLVRRGLVLREGDPDERRRIMLELTGEGSALLEAARARTRSRVAERLAALSASDLVGLSKGLEILRRSLDASGAVQERP